MSYLFKKRRWGVVSGVGAFVGGLLSVPHLVILMFLQKLFKRIEL